MHDFTMIAGLSALADRYDGFILDIWGVLHDGHKVYPGTMDCLARLRAAGKRTCLLSNAPRRNDVVVEALRQRFAIGRERYDLIYTSGEAVYEHLLERPDAFYRSLGRRFYQMGPADDASTFDGLDYQQVHEPAEADFVIATGVDAADETMELYEPVLQDCARHGLPLICANPDLIVNSGNHLKLCAGTMAQRYEELGGTTRYHGKPHPPVYAKCRELLGIADPRRIVCIGDSLRTDIAGANAAGLDGAMVLGGIHREELHDVESGTAVASPQKLAAAVAETGHRPTWAVPLFSW